MKTIIVASDYSEAATNAINYAAELAMFLDASLLLFHAFQAPVIMSEVPVIVPNVDELEKEHLKMLSEIEKQVHSHYGHKLVISTKVKCGPVVDMIVEIAKESKAELVVMGMHGESEMVEKLLGSTTTSLMQTASFPVLSIHSSVKFKAIKKIAFACDYLKIKNIQILDPLKQLVNAFKARIYILNVSEVISSVPTTDEAIAGVKLDKALEGFEHSFHQIQNEDLVEGLNSFSKAKEIDMMVMIPRKHSFLKNIFTESNTKRMAFHTELPLLTLHE